MWEGISPNPVFSKPITIPVTNRDVIKVETMCIRDREDAVYLGTSVPVYSGAINTTLRYKNWELAAVITDMNGHFRLTLLLSLLHI